MIGSHGVIFLHIRAGLATSNLQGWKFVDVRFAQVCQENFQVDQLAVGLLPSNFSKDLIPVQVPADRNDF